MNIRLLNIFAAGASVILTLALGCAKIVPSEKPNPESPNKPEIPIELETNDQAIAFSASTPAQTKAIVNTSNLNSSGNKIKIYDIVSFKSGKFTYIDDCLTYTDQWAPSKEYFWTRTGTHKFFGWFVEQGSTQLKAESLFGENGLVYSATGQGDNPTSFTLTTPVVAIDEQSAQFDFLYSDIVKRTMNNSTSPDAIEFSTVNFNMRHLFSAFTVSATNTKNTDVTICSIEILGLNNSKSAVIDFSSDSQASVEYLNAQHTANLKSSYPTDPGILLQANPERNATAPDLISGQGATTPFIFWPQTEAEITPAHEFSFDEQTGEAIYNENDPLLIIKYKIGNSNIHTVPFSIKEAVKNTEEKALLAGNIYHFDVVFADRFINLTCEVQPWNKTETEIDYSDGTIIYADSGRLSFDPYASIVDGNNVTIREGMPAIGHFKLQSPIGVTWMVHLNGDFDAFRLEVVGSDVVDGVNTSTFIIIPTIQSPTREYSVTPSINLRLPDGRVVNVDNELQPNPFRIILPAA